MCIRPLLGALVLGGSCSQGCAAKAPSVVRFCAAKAPTPPFAVRPYAAKATRAGSVCATKCAAKATRAGSVCAPLVLTGDFRPICGLPSVPAPAASDAATSVPVSAPVRPASAASAVAASDVPVTAGRVATGSAPMSAPPPRGKLTADDDGEVPYDPMLHPDVLDAMEDSLDIPKGCTLFSDIDGMV
ncbi:hypothetical protein V6N13_114003 [Hibiscus sabdariffa]|uniref:Uncharacterized protein n=1 Tax=Hibiscus sabdariffa TaxID=183260 RepID=A0ABR2U0J9_9ROSI